MNKRNYSADLILLILAISGIGFAALGFLCTLIGALDRLFASSPTPDSPILLGITAMIALIICGVPAVYWAGRGFLHDERFHTQPPSARFHFLTALLIILVIAAYLLGNQTSSQTNLMQPLFNVALAFTTAALAILTVLNYAPGLSQRRFWGQFLTGLYGISPLIIFLELLALIPFIMIFSASLLFGDTGELFAELFMEPGIPPADLWQNIDLGALLQPEHFLLLLLYLSLLVPLIEELFKTAAIWPFLGRGLSDAEAYLGGVLAGCGYGLFEALLLAQPGSFWFSTTITRIGATFLHAATAGLSSLFIARAFRRKRPWMAVPAYLLAVFIHGLWNANAIFSASEILNLFPDRTLFAADSTLPKLISNLVFLVLSLISFSSLHYFGRKVRGTPIAVKLTGEDA